ncbi:hypothetical protein GVN16_21900 [Emticicia sp. CRIBPO]|uniref:heparinase II/III family protein n=1 Tax=Emticicia sp. CRIBPO TaxID=2683258 RepID=UPI00141356DA|nr:heparinase II/III family protein [Emticicia sp. CRIBPO]NBA88443.1 hypothetical protein [Emticicia sp. CRIBPO]
MMKKVLKTGWLILGFAGSVCFFSEAQVALPVQFPAHHPRMIDDTLVTTQKLKNEVEELVDRHRTDPQWIVSRLQMYWKTKSTKVFIKGGVYDHAEGEAPVPTVRFPGARDHTTIYGIPKLEDIQPYMDDPRGILMVNRSKPDQPLEWADISKTGRSIESMNTNILGLAAKAGVLFRRTGEEKYAKFAMDIFDTYMSGMQYRSEPVDLTNGHHQTIAGLSTFEVIQEGAILKHITSVYDNLYQYIQQKKADKYPVYVQVLKKWADQQIKNGVAFNNWDLMQARHILEIGFVLEDDKTYPDGKGNRYYTNQVLNVDSERQWSLSKVLNEGFSPETGFWNESPGYSSGVLGDFVGYVNWFDQNYNDDLLPQFPVLEKATLNQAQYLFPNGYMTAFGDAYYTKLNTASAMKLVYNARKNGKKAQEERFSRYIKTINLHSGSAAENDLDKNILTGKIEDYTSPVFSAPSVSYFAQRNGMHPNHGLMVAMIGSKGNHMHANGISMEIFGKGIVLGPDAGIGTSYFQQDYAEYYSQFPAHNTVAVDGISAYPVMKSNHGFEVLSTYPASDQKSGYFAPVTFGELYFPEPETQSDQNRLTSIIRTSDTTGYYVDIFRSKKNRGGDKMHDYFYHNLGQELILTSPENQPLDLQPTPKLSFAGGHLFAYDYFWDKKSTVTDKDFKGKFRLSVPGKDDVFMNIWMKGSSDREIFSVKAPSSKSFRNNVMIPDSIAKLPMPTLVARQSGEAWTKPFVAVFEPSTSKEPQSVKTIRSFNPPKAPADFVGLVVESTSGSRELIFSSPVAAVVQAENSKVNASYAVISQNGTKLHYLFLGKGKLIEQGLYSISAREETSAALHLKPEGLFFFSDKPVELTLPDVYAPGKKVSLLTGGKRETVPGKRVVVGGRKKVVFNLPAVAYGQLEIQN